MIIGILLVWLVGLGISIPFSLKRRMNELVCINDDHSRNNTGHKIRPRAERYDRTGVDAFFAVLYSTYWPVYLLFRVCVLSTKSVGTFILKLAPLTGPELERKQKIKELELQKLMEEIENG